jgi:hypothetical protein
MKSSYNGILKVPLVLSTIAHRRSLFLLGHTTFSAKDEDKKTLCISRSSRSSVIRPQSFPYMFASYSNSDCLDPSIKSVLFSDVIERYIAAAIY